ncbi:caspase-8 isoform X2 [Nerophis lumbriciformis]|uniref:caspase-8 isoform X2 n=1 Tax=Nerophis lumbriciformis TaxID=546530 RepID=UPI002AE05200|nr:caspase-8-like isoform X2 [Nerophis lumbriciformis]
MDRHTLMKITDQLDSSDVASLCFLCRDVVHTKNLEEVDDAKDLFNRLEERGLLEDCAFLDELLCTVGREDLRRLLLTNRQCAAETDATPMLSNYRVMLYNIYNDITQDNMERMKFLLSGDLGRRQIEKCKTVLDIFIEMEKTGTLLSDTNLGKLHSILRDVDRQVALTVEKHINARPQAQAQAPPPSGFIMNYRHVNNNLPLVSISETQPSDKRGLISFDAKKSNKPDHSDQAEYYAMNRNPHGLCVIVSNEDFLGPNLRNRSGTRQDEVALESVFSRLGFKVSVHRNLAAEQIRQTLKELAQINFSDDDALVVCLLSHGENGCVFGTDEQKVPIPDLTAPFTSVRAPTLAGKPKLFFIQACQGAGYQTGSLPCPPRPSESSDDEQSRFETDAGPIRGETVPSDADFLFGMATVPQCVSFRSKVTGSIYIQELCKQLQRSAESPKKEDILTILTRVNREVSKGEYLKFKQMPQPKYTLTKTLVLRFADAGQVQPS